MSTSISKETPVQTIFDIIYKGLLAQGKQSIVPSNGRCMYRGPDGLKCAAGMLIPDDEYIDDMEDEGPVGTFYCRDGFEMKHSWFKKHLSPEAGKVVYELQLIHDRRLPKNWKEQMKSIALRYDLKVPE